MQGWEHADLLYANNFSHHALKISSRAHVVVDHNDDGVAELEGGWGAVERRRCREVPGRV